MSFAERIGFEKRKLAPVSGINHGVRHNGPDTPPIRRRELSGLAVILPNRRSTGSLDGHSVVKGAIIDTRYTFHKGCQVTPTTEEPLTHFFKTSHGGGRTYGGGTSREALRRARRKARYTP